MRAKRGVISSSERLLTKAPYKVTASTQILLNQVKEKNEYSLKVRAKIPALSKMLINIIADNISL